MDGDYFPDPTWLSSDFVQLRSIEARLQPLIRLARTRRTDERINNYCATSHLERWSRWFHICSIFGNQSKHLHILLHFISQTFPVHKILFTFVSGKLTCSVDKNIGTLIPCLCWPSGKSALIIREQRSVMLPETGHNFLPTPSSSLFLFTLVRACHAHASSVRQACARL